MKYQYTNITGRHSETHYATSAVIIIDGKAVRPGETFLFTELTPDICAKLDAGSISVQRLDGGSLHLIKTVSDFPNFTVEVTEQVRKIKTVDGHRVSTVRVFSVSPLDAVSHDETPEEVVEEVTEEVVEGVVEEPALEAETLGDEPENMTLRVQSDQMSAKEAVEFIESSTEEALEGFLAEGESRKSVMAAWSARFE